MTRPKNPGPVVDTRIGHDGRTLYYRQVTVPCSKCTKDFTCTITTKPPGYCPECQAIVLAERRTREKARADARRQKPQTKQPVRRLIPYAGYDSKEKSR